MSSRIDPKDPRFIKVNTYDGKMDDAFQKELKTFVETYGLYRLKKIPLPPQISQFRLDVAQLPCTYCRTNQPYRAKPQPTKMRFPSEGGYIDYLENDIYPIELLCQGCHKVTFNCLIRVDVNAETVQKAGQYPMWLPQVAPEILKELGEDRIFLQKAMRNMNEGYGIGACAYFRRLVEQYIDPLLKLLHEIKTLDGASADELAKIEEALKNKEFARKTEFAAEIAPRSIQIQGMNPIRKLHELLSISLHHLPEEEAMGIAHQLLSTIQFVIRQLRSRFEEQKAYVEAMKEASKIKPKI